MAAFTEGGDNADEATVPEEISKMPNKSASQKEGRCSAESVWERQPITAVKKTTHAQTERIDEVAEEIASEKQERRRLILLT